MNQSMEIHRIFRGSSGSGWFLKERNPPSFVLFDIDSMLDVSHSCSKSATPGCDACDATGGGSPLSPGALHFCQRRVTGTFKINMNVCKRKHNRKKVCGLPIYHFFGSFYVIICDNNITTIHNSTFQELSICLNQGSKFMTEPKSFIEKGCNDATG